MLVIRFPAESRTGSNVNFRGKRGERVARISPTTPPNQRTPSLSSIPNKASPSKCSGGPKIVKEVPSYAMIPSLVPNQMKPLLSSNNGTQFSVGMPSLTVNNLQENCCALRGIAQVNISAKLRIMKTLRSIVKCKGISDGCQYGGGADRVGRQLTLTPPRPSLKDEASPLPWGRGERFVNETELRLGQLCMISMRVFRAR